MIYLTKLEAHLMKSRHKGQMKEARRLASEAVFEYVAEQKARTWKSRLRLAFLKVAYGKNYRARI